MRLARVELARRVWIAALAGFACLSLMLLWSVMQRGPVRSAGRWSFALPGTAPEHSETTDDAASAAATSLRGARHQGEADGTASSPGMRPAAQTPTEASTGATARGEWVRAPLRVSNARDHPSLRRSYAPRAPDIDRSPFPVHIRDTLCQVPNLSPTDWFQDKTPPVEGCAPENHYNFSRVVQETLEILDCDGRVFLIGNNGLLSYPERRITSSRVDVSEFDQLVVECKTSDRESSFDFYMRVRYNALAHERARRLQAQFRQERTEETRNPDPLLNDEPPLNVLMLLIDSLSRANLLRSMPRTVDFLEHLHLSSSGGYSVYDFSLFNIVGSGTYQNLPPILTGTAYTDDWEVENMQLLPLRQGNQTLRDQRNEDAETFPSLWDIYHHRGYVTAFAEEGCVKNTGTVARVWHHKVKKDLDFEEHPMFQLAGGKIADHSFFTVFCDIMQRMRVNDFFSKSTRPRLCFGGRYVHQYTFDYLNAFFDLYPDVGRFAFAMMAEAHEAEAMRIRGMDGDLRSFLQGLLTRHPNTLVVIMGDHGLGYGDFSKTDAAKLEYKLPAFFMLMPSYALSRHSLYARNLAINQRRFVTGFDVYHTLAHLGHLDNVAYDLRFLHVQKPLAERQRIARERRPRDRSPLQGASLLSGPVSVNRTCKDMEIAMEYCACTNYHTVEDADSDIYKLLVDLVLAEVNHNRTGALDDSAKPCTYLHRDTILRVQIATTEAEEDKQIIVTFTTRADPARHITSETFEAVLYQRNETAVKGEAPLRIKSIMVGTGWKTDKKVFEGELNILPHDAGTVWCINRWETTTKDDEVQFDVEWVRPVTAAERAGEVEKVTDVEISGTWVMAWQPLVHTQPLEEGEWTIRVMNRKRKKLEASTTFYVMGKEFPGIPISALARYWVVKGVTRLSAYEPHRKCADPDKPLEFCVCDTSKPFK